MKECLSGVTVGDVFYDVIVKRTLLTSFPVIDRDTRFWFSCLWTGSSRVTVMQMFAQVNDTEKLDKRHICSTSETTGPN